MLDRASICVRGGRGGDGAMSFRREKYVPRGGPDGGDGAPGGDVVLVATRRLHDLTHFRHRHHFRAADGGAGRGGNRRGADGPELLVEVPVGTEVRTREGELLGDLVHDGQRLLVARGGEGGRGNVNFKSSTRQAPRFAERGLQGEELWVTLALKLLADVGLVGLPNAGKSSLLAALTRAKPKVAAYPFTTVTPNLGVLSLDEGPVVIADIPGLIEGASEGAGLGHRFLAHIERTAAVVYVVDGADGADAWPQALRTVRAELRAFRPELLERPSLVLVTKADLLGPEEVAAAEEFLASLGWPEAGLVVSALDGRGLEVLGHRLGTIVGRSREAARPEQVAGPEVLRPGADRLEAFTLERVGEDYVVHGRQLERLFAKADLDNEDAVAYLQEVVERAGLNDALRRAGAEPGDTVIVGGAEFEFA
ncbi:MAG TPA: GTPase ObgE [Thermoleophilia bacterium]|nr:GTPase ObgE [Actinomycetota bacterium]HOU28450.1 GTPase ObgE [Thermoleophilia bacterium]HQH21562.1 GTPase ObgE [Thermoleophilia bacterium]